MMEELDTVVLTIDLPGHNLKAGYVGTVVYVHEGSLAYEVEFITLSGETTSVETLKAEALRPAASNEIAHVRQVAEAVR